MSKSNINLINDRIVCDICGAEKSILYPIGLKDLKKSVNAFLALHERGICKEFYTLLLSVHEKGNSEKET